MNAILSRSIFESLFLLKTLLAMVTILPVVFFLPSAHASLYWFQDVRDNEISLCFTGDAVTANPDRVLEVVGYLQHFIEAANIHFLTLNGTPIRDAASATGNIQELACPSFTWIDDSTSHYEGDIRVALRSTNVKITPATDMVPGAGCTQTIGATSWSNAPDDLDTHRPCQYNLKLLDDSLDMTIGRPGQDTGTPWLNHTLHEFGHALGLSHEHARVDENAQCVPTTNNKEYHNTANGYITPYDKNSVMHYRFWPDEVPLCFNHTGTNYSNEGLTSYDKLALHIMYPEDVLIAEFTGTTVVKTDERLILRSTLTQQGATSYAIKNFSWHVDGNLVSTSDTLDMTFPTPGDHVFRFTYQDFLLRTYSYTGTLHVLDTTTFNNRLAAMQEVLLIMMTSATDDSSTTFPWSTFIPHMLKDKNK